MPRIELSKHASGKIVDAKKSAINTKSQKYKTIVEETNRRIDESHVRYANAYRRAASFIAR